MPCLQSDKHSQRLRKAWKVWCAMSLAIRHRAGGPTVQELVLWDNEILKKAQGEVDRKCKSGINVDEQIYRYFIYNIFKCNVKKWVKI